MRVRVTNQDNDLFGCCWELYVSAFPSEERRDMEYQLETMQRVEYHFDAVVDGDTFVGILAWWQFENLRYIEHFATCAELRGGGYGAKILTQFKAECGEDDKIIFEVEHPDCDMNRRRIKFYEREGFHLNHHDFAHPSYEQPSDERVPLMIMTYPQKITAQSLEDFTQRYFPLVHFRCQSW